jgi:hypothetical protein
VQATQSQQILASIRIQIPGLNISKPNAENSLFTYNLLFEKPRRKASDKVTLITQ